MTTKKIEGQISSMPVFDCDQFHKKRELCIGYKVQIRLKIGDKMFGAECEKIHESTAIDYAMRAVANQLVVSFEEQYS